MRQFLQETKILIILLIILTTTTVLSYFDLGAEAGSQPSPSEMLKMSLSHEEQTQRSPAAIENSKNEILKAEIFCEKKEKLRFKKVSQSLVMLSLNVCKDLKSARHIWIKNETNGFKAQLFKIGEKNFRTDFIQLNPGTNKLLVETVLKDGQKTSQSLEIISGS